MPSTPSSSPKSPSSRRVNMIEGEVGPSLIQMAVPMMLGIVSIMLFNLVDTFYISQLGNKELVAISFTFPVTFILMSFSFGIGIGASSVISNAIGEGDHHRVKRLTTDSLFLVGLIISMVACLSYVFLEPIFLLLGASSETMPLIEEYMKPWLFGVLFVVIPIVGNSAIRATGDTKTPSLIMLLAAVSNAVLDPILIFGWGPIPSLGIFGAALATVISYFSIMVAGLWVLGHREQMLTKEWPGLSGIMNSWRSLLFIGIPATLTQLLFPFSNAILTRIAAEMGENTVAAFGVGTRVESLSMIGIMGLSSVLTPFIGQNYGAMKLDRIRQATAFSIKFSIIWGVVLWAILSILSKGIAGVFSDIPEVQDMIQKFFWIVPFGFAFYGIAQILSNACNALRRPFESTALNVIRLFIFLIPLAYYGAYFWNYDGFLVGIALGNFFTGIVSFWGFKFWVLPQVLGKNY